MIFYRIVATPKLPTVNETDEISDHEFVQIVEPGYSESTPCDCVCICDDPKTNMKIGIIGLIMLFGLGWTLWFFIQN